MMHVVAGILEQDGYILICQRHENSRRSPLKWEFPGGKVEEGETSEQALERELEEELGIRVTRSCLTEKYDYAYAGESSIHLNFFTIDSYEGTPSNRIFQTMAWVRPEKLTHYDFLEGDKKMIGILTQASRS